VFIRGYRSGGYVTTCRVSVEQLQRSHKKRGREVQIRDCLPKKHAFVRHAVVPVILRISLRPNRMVRKPTLNSAHITSNDPKARVALSKPLSDKAV
jgi:hypothetical protein